MKTKDQQRAENQLNHHMKQARAEQQQRQAMKQAEKEEREDRRTGNGKKFPKRYRKDTARTKNGYRNA